MRQEGRGSLCGWVGFDKKVAFRKIGNYLDERQ